MPGPGFSFHPQIFRNLDSVFREERTQEKTEGHEEEEEAAAGIQSLQLALEWADPSPAPPLTEFT